MLDGGVGEHGYFFFKSHTRICSDFLGFLLVLLKVILSSTALVWIALMVL